MRGAELGRQLTFLGVAAGLAALLLACGGGGGSAPGMGAAAPNAPQTGDLRGNVADSAGLPVAGVSVRLFHHNDNTTVSTVTDSAGNFRFTGVDASSISDYALYAQSDTWAFGLQSTDAAAQATRFDFMGQYRAVLRLHPMPAREVTGIGFVAYRAGEARVQLARTGQTRSYASGDDAARAAGLSWPVVRLRDNHDGTVTDQLTGLVWLQDAGCLSASDWSTALQAAQNLAQGQCGLVDGSRAGQWRVPNANELESLVDVGQAQPALPAGHPFARVRLDTAYWTSTTYTAGAGNAMAIRFTDGRWINGVDAADGAFQNGKTSARNGAWAVRGDGSSGRVRLLATGVYAGVGGGSFAVGDDAALGLGMALTSPRFIDRGDGTLTDSMTGLVWLKQADCIRQDWNGALAAVQSLAHGVCGLGDGSTPGQWRLPNRAEMLSLSDRAPTFPQASYFNGQYQGSATASGPAIFRNFVVSDYYWTSSTDAADVAQAWSVYSCDFGVYNLGKSERRYALAVR